MWKGAKSGKAYLEPEVLYLDALPGCRQRDKLVRRDGRLPGDGAFEVVQHGELVRINLQALARVGNQHLGGHPETLPTQRVFEEAVAVSDATVSEVVGRQSEALFCSCEEAPGRCDATRCDAGKGCGCLSTVKTWGEISKQAKTRPGWVIQ